MRQERYREILARIRDAVSGTEFENHVYAVGGCVRDEVLGSTDIKDIDLVVSLPDGGIRFARSMEQRGLTHGSVVVYETYGTAMFRLAAFPDEEIECVQTRKEQYRDAQSRNPETAYGTVEEDCMRRDLTINALYFNVSTFEMADPCSRGLADIRDKVIRVTSTPDIVYSDDPLRILRAIRFRAKLGPQWTIAPQTMAGIHKNVLRLEIITKERIQTEFNKILLAPDYMTGLHLLWKTFAMKFVVPELCQTFTMTQNEYHFGTVWQHTLKVMECLDVSRLSQDDVLVLRMAALLHDIGKITTRTEDSQGNVHFYRHDLASEKIVYDVLMRLHYPVAFIRKVQFLCQNHMMTKQWKDDLSGTKHKTRSVRKLQYLCVTRERFEHLMRLIDADNHAHAEGHCLPNQAENIRIVSDRLYDRNEDMFEFRLPVDGEDIMAFKNIGPSRTVKDYLDYLLKLCFNNPTMTKDELLAKIRNLTPEKLHPHKPDVKTS